MTWWPFLTSSPATSVQRQSNPLPSALSISSDLTLSKPAHLTQPSQSPDLTDSIPSSGTADNEPDPSLPRTMSCRAAFDSAFFCSSFGGHFNDIYRYGQLRSCSDHWDDFWFCMRTKNSYNEKHTKERMVQERYQEKEDKIKSRPNSEDVWTKRAPGEEIVGAFGMREGNGK